MGAQQERNAKLINSISLLFNFERQEYFVFVFAPAPAVVAVDVILVFDNVVLVSHDRLSLACCYEYSANLSTNPEYGLFRSKRNNNKTPLGSTVRPSTTPMTPG